MAEAVQVTHTASAITELNKEVLVYAELNLFPTLISFTKGNSFHN